MSVSSGVYRARRATEGGPPFSRWGPTAAAARPSRLSPFFCFSTFPFLLFERHKTRLLEQRKQSGRGPRGPPHPQAVAVSTDRAPRGIFSLHVDAEEPPRSSSSKGCCGCTFTAAAAAGELLPMHRETTPLAAAGPLLCSSSSSSNTTCCPGGLPSESSRGCMVSPQ